MHWIERRKKKKDLKPINVMSRTGLLVLVIVLFNKN